jgi:hypothetical protein
LLETSATPKNSVEVIAAKRFVREFSSYGQKFFVSTAAFNASATAYQTGDKQDHMFAQTLHTKAAKSNKELSDLHNQWSDKHAASATQSYTVSHSKQFTHHKLNTSPYDGDS